MEDFEEQLKKVASLIKHKKVDWEYGTIRTETVPTVWVLKEKSSNFVKERVFLGSPDIIGLAHVLDFTVFEVMHVEPTLKLSVEYWLVKEYFSLYKVFPKLNNALLKIHCLISVWSAQGWPEVRELISEFKHLIPNEYKQHKVPLYRGLMLSPTASVELAKNKPIKLQKKLVSSWSTKFDKAKSFSSYGTRNDVVLGVIMTYIPKKEDVIVNINLFEKSVIGNLSHITNAHEEEILLRNSPEMLIVHPEQVIYYNNEAEMNEPETLPYHEFKHRIKGSNDSDEEVLKEIQTLIKHDKLLWNYGINVPLTKANLWYMDKNDNHFRHDKSDYVATGTVGVVKHKNFTVLKRFNFEHELGNVFYTYEAIKDREVVLKVKLGNITDNDIKIMQLLYQWGVESNDETGKKLEALKIPSIYKQIPKQLYRGLSLSSVAHYKIHHGKSIKLENREFSSWSTEVESAQKFARVRPVLIKYFPTKSEVLININLFCKKVFGNEELFPHYLENEVILKNSPDMLIVHPDQVVKD